MESIENKLEIVMSKLDEMEQAQREYAQRNNATVKALDTKVDN